MVTLNVDNSPTPVKVDLSDLFTDDTEESTYSGVDLARILENRINKAYGDLRYFNLESLAVKDVVTEEFTGVINLFEMKLGEEEELISITLPGTAPFDPTRVTIEDLSEMINAALAVAVPTVASATARVAPTFSFSPSDRTFKLEAASSTDVVQIKSFTDGTTNEVFDLESTYVTVNKDTDSYGGFVIPNGESIRTFEAQYKDSDQRTGIRVRFDDTTGTFSMFSGTTGDEASVEVVFPFENGSTTERLTAANFAADLALAGSEKRAFEAFQAIFNFSPGKTDVELLPTRGIRSTAASVTGGPIGLNLDNKFTLSSETNKFTVTVDNVTGLIELPLSREYTKESFRELLELRINSLEDSRGRTVNGAKVTYETLGNSTLLRISTGTEGDDSFLKVTGPSIWGLNELPSGRGSTERWLIPPQAENANGVPLFVDRDGNETTQAGDFSEEETRELWSPVFLDKGELTFNTAGGLISPRESIRFKPTTIGDTGATLQFAINYEGSTQFSSPFSVLAQNQNGRPEGDLIGLDIGDDGLVSANYSNGSQENLAKIILANFSAPTGLRQIGDASYLATSKSGATTLGEAGTAGFGTVRAGARERANVDLTQELIELITAQRNFQANAKAIETNNTLTQAIINIRN
jgi:flagellar hook protein FlgE